MYTKWLRLFAYSFNAFESRFGFDCCCSSVVVIAIALVLRFAVAAVAVAAVAVIGAVVVAAADVAYSRRCVAIHSVEFHLRSINVNQRNY